MPHNINHDHFSFTYRADCTTCEKYVGPKRNSKQEASTDVQIHKSKLGNDEHIVKIEVTQSYHII